MISERNVRINRDGLIYVIPGDRETLGNILRGVVPSSINTLVASIVFMITSYWM
ncbi:uncharacterized protein METZ01_LOCUS328624, partial [marine metagenome]